MQLDRYTSVLTIFFMTSIFIGCSETSDLSQSSHDIDKPIRELNSSYQWIEMNRAEYAQILAPIVGIQTSSLISYSDPDTKRAQKWLDVFDEKLRRDHPDLLRSVPKPKAMVLENSGLNAFVAPVATCFDVKVRWGRGPLIGPHAAAYVSHKTGTLSHWSDTSLCKKRDSIATLKEFITKFNAKNSPCSLKLDTEESTVTASPDCEISSAFLQYGGAEYLALLSTSNYISFYTGLFDGMSEKEFAAIAAHELGHYYRAHTVAWEGEYGFFYQLNRHNRGFRPKPAAHLQQLGQAAVDGSKILRSSEYYKQVQSQPYRSELHFTIGGIIRHVCESGDCSPSCKKADDLLTSNQLHQNIGTFPFQKLSTQGSTVYSNLNELSRQCLEGLDVRQTGPSVDSDSFTIDFFLRESRDPSWPTWLGNLGQSTRSTLTGLFALNSNALTGLSASDRNGYELILAASKRFDDRDHLAASWLRQAYQLRLGQYTAEQEADDASVEWLSDNGIDPHYALSAHRTLGHGQSRGLRGYLWDQEQCDKLMERNWLDENQSYVFVPVGDYSEPHHSQCFRIFNLSREIESHQFLIEDTDHIDLDPMWELQPPRTKSIPLVQGTIPLEKSVRKDWHLPTCTWSPGLAIADM